ncbi:MAG: GNAT family N-acetyltransferase [Planctomycetota bacterium]
MAIREDDLTCNAVIALLEVHLKGVAMHSPPESIHALDLDGLRAPDMTFWTAWRGADLAGCGALRELDAEHGEIKSMRTAEAHLRRGVARALLAHMLDVARSRAYVKVSLETGAQDGFAPAHALYRSFGFNPCGPFGSYREDPNSLFMTRQLDG